MVITLILIMITLVGQVRSDSWESWGFSGGMWWVPPLLQVGHDHHDHANGDHNDDDCDSSTFPPL